MRYSYLFDTDAYKLSQWKQYPKDMSGMFSYVSARSGNQFDKTVYFGNQYYMKEYLTHRVTPAEVEKAQKFWTGMGMPFNYDGWMHIARKHEGRLPVRIRSVPEGTVVPTKNVLSTIESTDPDVPWVPGWLETRKLSADWYGTSVATLSWHCRQIIWNALVISSDDPGAEIDFKLHDFGSRGVSSQESAMIGGAAHLVNFKGSDTSVGILCANDYYNIEMAGFSIPATEHSTITSWGRKCEREAYENFLDQFAKPGTLLACVSDSYDIYNACANIWGDQLREKIIDSGATLVVRPDSGEPATVVLKVAQILASKFGVTVNSKGYKVLKNVRIIQGDGINQDSIKKILDTLLADGFSASNIAFGMGGALLQQIHRDTLGFAMKCSQIWLGETSIDVIKDPVTDPGKKSFTGRLDLVRWMNGNWQTVRLSGNTAHHEFSAMRTVYENGEILVDDSFENIRRRALAA